MITMAPALRDASRLSQGLRHEELRDVVEGVEEDRTVEGVIRERYRLGSGLVKRPRGNGLPRDRQRLAVRVDPNDTRSDSDRARTPGPQPTSRISFLESGANAAAMTDMASVFGDNTSFLMVPVATDV